MDLRIEIRLLVTVFLGGFYELVRGHWLCMMETEDSMCP